MRSQNTRLRTRDCFLLAIAKDNMEVIINGCFHGRELYALLNASTFPLSKKGHDDAFATIKKLNMVLEVRLQLRAAGQPSSLAKTWEMLPKLAKGIGGETALKPLR